MSREAAAFIATLLLTACGGESVYEHRDAGKTGSTRHASDAGGAADAGNRRDADTDNVVADGGAAHDVDAAVRCDSPFTPRVSWWREFERDNVPAHPVYNESLSAAPAGMVRCGDGLCLIGKLESRIRFDKDLIAQGKQDSYLARLTLEGAPVWSQRLGGQSSTDVFGAASLVSEDNGNILVLGTCSGKLVVPTKDGASTSVTCSDNTSQLVGVTFDPAGHFVSAVPITLGTSPRNASDAFATIDRNGRVIVAAHIEDPQTPWIDAQAVIMTVARDGTFAVLHTFTGGVTYPTGLATDSDGNIVLLGFFAGYVTSTPADATDGGDAGGTVLDTGGSAVCTMKLDPSGKLAWSRCFGGNSLQALNPQLALTTDGSVVMAGTFEHQVDFASFGRNAAPSATRLSSAGGADIYLAKLGPDGSFQWQRQFGSADTQTAYYGLAATVDGTILLPGTTDGPLSIGDFQVTPGSYSSPFIAGLDSGGRPSFVVELGRSALLSGAQTLIPGACRSFYFAADYEGNLLAPDASRHGDIVALTVLGGQY